MLTERMKILIWSKIPDLSTEEIPSERWAQQVQEGTKTLPPDLMLQPSSWAVRELTQDRRGGPGVLCCTSPQMWQKKERAHVCSPLQLVRERNGQGEWAQTQGCPQVLRVALTTWLLALLCGSLGTFSSGLLAKHSRIARALPGVWCVAGALASRGVGWACYSSHPQW